MDHAMNKPRLQWSKIARRIIAIFRCNCSRNMRLHETKARKEICLIPRAVFVIYSTPFIRLLFKTLVCTELCWYAKHDVRRLKARSGVDSTISSVQTFCPEQQSCQLHAQSNRIKRQLMSISLSVTHVFSFSVSSTSGYNLSLK